MRIREVVAVGMARTAIGNFMGSLKDVSAVDLGKIAGEEALKRSGIEREKIGEVIVGMVYKTGCGGNPARQIGIALGIPEAAGALTVEQQCASGMRAIEIAFQQIMLGKSDASLVIGMESMTNVPFLVMNARKGYRLGDGKFEDGLYHDALTDVFSGVHMANTAENLAEEYGISRREQDELALLSQQRALQAIAEGKFKEEIVPVPVRNRKGAGVFDVDEHPRETTIEQLEGLKAAFRKNGTVTAGNASGLNDGASAIVLMARDLAEELQLKPLFRILSTATVGVPPRIMGIGPVYEIPKAAEYAGLQIKDIDYFEINEAFAAQFLACNRELRLDMEDVNRNGSGISLGHPVGSTGVRLLISGYYELKRRGQEIGCGSLCAGGGPGMAIIYQCLN